MSDRDLRALERAARSSPDDAQVWVRYVREHLRSGGGAPPPGDLAPRFERVVACLRSSPAHALLEAGDRVWVEELESPYISGRWRGLIRAVHFAPDPVSGRLGLRFRVWPLGLEDPIPEIAWRVSPQPQWLVHGLELSGEDRLELIERAPRPSTWGPPAQ